MVAGDVREGVGAVVGERGGLAVDGHGVERVALVAGEGDLLGGAVADRQGRAGRVGGAVLDGDVDVVGVDHVAVGVDVGGGAGHGRLGGRGRVGGPLARGLGVGRVGLHAGGHGFAEHDALDVGPGSVGGLLLEGEDVHAVGLVGAVPGAVDDLVGHGRLVLVRDAVGPPGRLRAGLVLGVVDLNYILRRIIGDGQRN